MPRWAAFMLLTASLSSCTAFSPSSLVWYTTDLRLHDHKALHTAKSDGSAVAPVYIFDRKHLASQAPQTIQLTLSAVRDLKSAFQKLGGDLIVREGLAEDVLPQLARECEAGSVWCHDDVSTSQRELAGRGLASLPSAVERKTWAARLRPTVTSSAVGDTYPSYVSATRGVRLAEPLPSPTALTFRLPQEVGRLPSFEELLEAAHAGEDEAVRATRAAAARDEFLTPVYAPPVEAGEGLALRWLDEYLQTGPEAFGQRHLPLTGDNGLEREAVRRVIASQGLKGLFEGEVFSRSFSPLLGVGCLSARQVAKAVAAKDINRAFLQPKDPEVAALEQLLEQKEWHSLLAQQDLSVAHKEGEPLSFGYWKWHGYLVRYAGPPPGQRDPALPNLLLVHGFGASADQWAKCFGELAGRYNVFAVDLLGFGHSEKTPVTYTQYMWQDQVRDFALEVIQGPYFIAGNSIGGYISMSVAADNKNLCRGLILINTAGKIVSGEVYEAELAGRSGLTIEEATRTRALGPFSGPPKLLLRAVSQGLFWYLQPRVEEICRNLYKARPEQVGPRLVNNIVRDSQDPGALGVFASGGRLPPPRPANELLRKFGGPVLVAQGALDPLNDAKGRAELLRTCYERTRVALVQAGHCPHDEDPEAICRAIDEFVTDILGGSGGGGGEAKREGGSSAAVAAAETAPPQPAY